MLKRILRGISRRADRIFSPRLRKIKAAFGISTRYGYGKFSILLPGDHLLPVHQAHHKLYDKFLPHLVSYLEPSAAVIDVGANCGDTLAAMHERNSALRYLCIEPDDAFFEYLDSNVQRIRAANAGASITTFKALVGKGVSKATLGGSGGTKHAIVGEPASGGQKAISSVTLDGLLSEVGGIQLLKSDVDGFDYDVIDSAEQLIRNQLPLLFFECDFGDEAQKIEYKRTIATLEAAGYHEWIAFDNFGELVLKTGDVNILFQLFDYVGRQNAGRTTRTIFYFDVLAATQAHKELLATVVADYTQLQRSEAVTG